MKAVSFTQFGDADVLGIGDVDAPHAGLGQIRVLVRAAAVNPMDIKVRRGWMQPGLPASLPCIPGYDAAGVVDEVGEGVVGLAVGDEVLGNGFSGAYAEFAIADASKVTIKPSAISWELASGFSSVASTADRVLRQLDLTAGQTLLIHGASGAVGSLAVQIAVSRGVTVIGSGGPRSQDQLGALGAIPVIYGEGMGDRVRAASANSSSLAAVDRALDCGGRGDLPTLIELAGSPDNVVTIADPAAESLGVRFSGGGDFIGLAPLVAQLDAGTLTLALGQVFPLNDAAQAQALVESGHACGRTILRVS